ncbi:MAG: hypothetical protein INR73_27115 [Williamsia sp.]|nr:hypothetical protein [Williamsia sp.]
MKNFIAGLACLFVLTSSCLADMPNEKVLKSFQSTFATAKQVKWMEHEDYFDVSFVQADIRSNVRYDKEGNFMNCTRYYTEQQLPVNIACKLKSKYADKTVFGITEVTNPDDITYYVKMFDNKHWYCVKVNSSGQTEIVEKYRKA